MSRAATLTSAAALLASTPAGAAALASVKTALAAKASALLVTAFPAGPVIAAAVAATRAVVRDIAGGWEARERCRQAAWLDLFGRGADDVSGYGRVVHLDEVPTADWPSCWHEGLKTSDRRNGRLSYRPGGKLAGVVTREDFAESLGDGGVSVYGGKSASGARPGVGICGWMGPYSVETRYGLRLPYGDAASALALELAKAPLPPLPVRTVVAARLLARAHWWRSRPLGASMAAEYESAAVFADAGVILPKVTLHAGEQVPFDAAPAAPAAPAGWVGAAAVGLVGLGAWWFR